MDILVYLAYVFVGMLAGLAGGVLGLSGGVIAVPCLALIFTLVGFPEATFMHMALGTSLASTVIVGIVASWAHHRHKGVLWSIVFTMVPGIFLGCLLGSFVAHFLSGIILQIIFGTFVCLLGAYMLLKTSKKKAVSQPDKTLYTWIGLGIGTLASLLGIGGGVFTVPLLMGYGFPEKKAIGTSAATGFFITFFGTMGYLYWGLGEVKMEGSFGYIYLPAFLLMALGTVIFAPIGARIAHRIKGKTLRKVFAGTLILMGILMIFN